MSRRPLLFLLALALSASALPAQSSGLRSVIRDNLFKFGDCDEPLCLSSSLAQGGHGDHFIGASVEGTANLIDFLSNAIGVGVSSIPIAATTSGVTFKFEGGLPVKTSVSAGPIFGERAQTLGRGRLLVGANVTGLEFKSVRGVPLDNVTFNFTHTPSSFPGDTTLGSPLYENDIITVNTSIDLNIQIASLFLTYGLLDRVDVSVAVPLVRTSLRGGSVAQVLPFDFPTPHFFGTSADPSPRAASSFDGTATGIGDIAGRVKVLLASNDRTGFAILGDVRFPTGKEEDFLGSGDVSVRGLGVFSARLGNFAPHVNAGYAYRQGDLFTDAILTTAGFDHLMASWATLAVDFIGEWEVGTNRIPLPGPVTFATPSRRVIEPTNIPVRRDHLLNGAIGVKLTNARGFTVVTNVLVPLNRGGIRSDWIWTAGAEYVF